MDPTTGKLTDMNTWRARCSETGTPGSAGGPGKRTEGNLGTAPGSDPTTTLPPQNTTGHKVIEEAHPTSDHRPVVAWFDPHRSNNDDTTREAP